MAMVCNVALLVILCLYTRSSNASLLVIELELECPQLEGSALITTVLYGAQVQSYLRVLFL